VTEAEDRKPQSDEARSAFRPPSGVGAPVDGESSTTSEFEIPQGLAVPRNTGSESETTSEFALPEGLDAPTGTPAETEGSAFSMPSTYHAWSPAAFTPASGFPAVNLTDVPWQDRMRAMLRMPVADRPAPEPSQKHDDETGPAVPRVLDLTLRIGELLLAARAPRTWRRRCSPCAAPTAWTAASRTSPSPCCRSPTSRPWSRTR
jgi:hypothetical protein